jgi:hypothetical protein
VHIPQWGLPSGWTLPSGDCPLGSAHSPRGDSPLGKIPKGGAEAGAGDAGADRSSGAVAAAKG